MSELRAENISFGYAGAPALFEGLSLAVRGGERVALRAPSGFGKSTLCQILAGYLEPDAGEVTVDGGPVRARPGKPNPVQLVWQHPEQALDPYVRIRKSIGEAAPVPGELLEGLGVRDEWLDRFPHELSGGELQRCCLARTLSVAPRFIIADEISTMLDAVTQVQIWEFLLEYCKGRDVGLVLVTHSDALLERLATRTLDLA